jgi:hypothetical protein
LLQDRYFQAGVKYWLVLSLVLVVVLLVMEYVVLPPPSVPTFALVAAALAMSERVETTATKVGREREED